MHLAKVQTGVQAGMESYHERIGSEVSAREGSLKQRPQCVLRARGRESESWCNQGARSAWRPTMLGCAELLCSSQEAFPVAVGIASALCPCPAGATVA